MLGGTQVSDVVGKLAGDSWFVGRVGAFLVGAKDEVEGIWVGENKFCMGSFLRGREDVEMGGGG